MDKYEIITVNSKRERKIFVRLPHLLYKNNPTYVPQLNASINWLISSKNPFFEHSEVCLFLVKKNGNYVGRIASIYNTIHLKKYDDNSGFFGLFDSIDDENVTNLLFKACEQWLKQKGVNRIIGPASLTTNDTCGFLIHGFDIPPFVAMPYNFDYYNNLCIRFGFEKYFDLNSYNVDGSAIYEKYKNVHDYSVNKLNKADIKIRNISKSNFIDDIKELNLIYNEVNEEHNAFMPLNEKEFFEMAKDLKLITPLDLTLLAIKDNKIIAYLIAVPNMNEILIKINKGKLFPFGFIKLFAYRKKIKSARIMLLGVKAEYKNSGLDIVMYQKIKEALNKRNIYNAEACYIFEHNHTMNSILEKISEGLVRKFRMYTKEIN
ncbi:MAG: hypothetical protein H6Q15_1954 [Bacteroidetes bacterium]|nr:hypothetical protein [Bacteroidota bacterium]